MMGGGVSAVLFSRFKFQSRRQQARETLDEFAKALMVMMGATTGCGSPPCRCCRDLLRDRFVAGLRNRDLKRRLLASDQEAGSRGGIFRGDAGEVDLAAILARAKELEKGGIPAWWKSPDDLVEGSSGSQLQQENLQMVDNGVLEGLDLEGCQQTEEADSADDEEEQVRVSGLGPPDPSSPQSLSSAQPCPTHLQDGLLEPSGDDELLPGRIKVCEPHHPVDEEHPETLVEIEPDERGPSGTYKCGHCDSLHATISELNHHVAFDHADLGGLSFVCQVGSYATIKEADSVDEVCKGFELPDHPSSTRILSSARLCSTLLQNGLLESPSDDELISGQKNVCSPHHPVREEHPETLVKVEGEQNGPSGTFKCGSCDFRHATRGGLNRHVAYHHPDPGGPSFVCHICGYATVKEHNLNLHIAMVHDKVKHPCPVCGKLFSHKTAIKNHVQVAHNNKLPYSCESCGKAFTNSYSLKVHKSSIHGNVWHHCDVCNQKFAELKSMRNHKLTVHERQHRHVCTYCNKGFQRPIHLQTHISRVHQEEALAEMDQQGTEGLAEADSIVASL